MDRFTSLRRLRLRVWWLRRRAGLLRAVADRMHPTKGRLRLILRYLALEDEALRLTHPHRPQMWLETHPPQDQPNPTP